MEQKNVFEGATDPASAPEEGSERYEWLNTLMHRSGLSATTCSELYLKGWVNTYNAESGQVGFWKKV